MIKKIIPVLFFVILSFLFFKPFFLENRLPIPADTIVGLYYPFRDLYSKTNPSGIAFKNFLITDPVRQTFPWRNLSISEFKDFSLPLWNPYNFSGTPLLANFQSAPFYSLNLLFFIFPFEIAWSLLIVIGPILAGIFLFLFLNNLKIKKAASILGAIAFSYGGFFIAWLEWGTIVNTALWLPLILLSIDKIFEVNGKKHSIWSVIFVLSLPFSLFAGHLQTFFYLAVFSLVYFLARWFQFGKNLKVLVLFLILTSLFLILTFIQWFPSLQFIFQSARRLDIISIDQPGWFIPWQNLIQFIAPDFFGNPSTLNYFGLWNYGEFVGYIGIAPLIMALYAMFFRKDKKTLFFGISFFVSIIFAFPNLISKIPFILNIPLVSTSQPTRLIFIAGFSLSVLAALGLDYFLKSEKKKTILYILAFFALIFSFLWAFVLLYSGTLITPDNLHVSRQNIILPTALFTIVSLTLIINSYFAITHNKFPFIILASCILILITVFDLFRFGWKFESFSDEKYLFPNTKITSFLKSQREPFRVISSDSTIFPPNFSIMYKIQTLDGYDPLYLSRYGELMAAIGRGKPDISTPFGFNRIITPQNISSSIMDLLNVRYVLSTKDLADSKLTKVFEDGKTKIYFNNLYFDRAFFVEKTLTPDSKQEAMNELFNINNPLKRVATVEEVSDKSLFKKTWRIGKVQFLEYGENKIILESQNEGDGYLVLTDAYYPTWRAKIDGKETEIYITDYAFRGIIVPRGKHTVEFYNSLF